MPARGWVICCLLAVSLPALAGASDRSAAAHGAARNAASPYPLVAPTAQVLRLTPRPIAVTGITTHAGDLVVAPAGGTVVFSIATGVRGKHAVSVSGWLSAAAATDLSLRTATGWKPVGLSDDGDPITDGRFAIPPVEIGGAKVTFRLAIHPLPAIHAAVVLKDLKVYALLPAQSLCGARPCTPIIPSRGAGLLSPPRAQSALAAPDFGGLNVISRADWGAPPGESSPLWVPAYERPYHIIIHHTDQNPGLNGATADVLTIWSYHTYSLGWGDIGYNYMIDAYGNIYEGRAGGDEVVGAHTERFNYGAIAISLMGDYSSTKPTKAMLAALRRLLVTLTNKYGIDPQGTFTLDGATYNTIAGHRDFNYTFCPGGNVYDLLGNVRFAVSHSVRSNAALDTGESIYVNSGRPVVADMVIRNTGTTTWNGRYSIRLTAGDDYLAMNLPTSYNVPDVKPGGSITIPLFLPTLKDGQVINTDWRLIDMSGNYVGDVFPLSIIAVGAHQATPAPAPPPPLTNTPIPTQTPIPTATQTAAPINTRAPKPTATIRAPKPSATPRKHG